MLTFPTKEELTQVLLRLRKQFIIVKRTTSGQPRNGAGHHSLHNGQQRNSQQQLLLTKRD